MKQLMIQTDFSIQGFKAAQIIFDDSDLVSMEIKCRLNGELKNTTLLFTFSLFNDLLRYSGSIGEQLQLVISNKLLGKEQPPYIISLQSWPLIFTNCQLELAFLIADDESCLSVESVKPLSFLQQAQNLKNNMRDFEDVHLTKDTILNQALLDIASLYKYYLGLLELNINESSAREKAGLQNEKIFKMAYFAAKRM